MHIVSENLEKYHAEIYCQQLTQNLKVKGLQQSKGYLMYSCSAENNCLSHISK